MRFAVIMQHANIAYHVQRAYKILTQTNEITHTLVKVKWPAPN